MGRHATTFSSSTGTLPRARLKGAAPQIYSGTAQQTQPSFPTWFWFLLIAIALVLLVVSHV